MIHIVFVVDYSCGGIGDIVRCLLNLYTYSCLHQPYISLSIDMNSRRGDLHKYFSYKKYSHDDNTNFVEIEHMRMPSCKCILSCLDKWLNILRDGSNKNYMLRITSNEYGLVSRKEIKSHLDTFKRDIFRPSDMVLDFMKEKIFPNLQSKRHISYHIRFGDYVIRNIDKEYNEKRLDMNNNIFIECVHKIKLYKQKYPNHAHIIHSDSIEFKKKIAERLDIYMFPSEISHTAEKCVVNQDYAYLTTIAEFFFISQAELVVQLCSYSGFSHIASVYGDTDFCTDCPENDIYQSFSR